MTNQELFDDLRAIKLRFVKESTPLDIIEAIETNLLTREEWWKLHQEVEHLKALGVSLNFYSNNLTFRATLQAGDYDITALGMNVHKINVSRIR